MRTMRSYETCTCTTEALLSIHHYRRTVSWSSETFRDYESKSAVLPHLVAAINSYLDLLADPTRPLAKYLPDYWRSPDNYFRLFTPAESVWPFTPVSDIPDFKLVKTQVNCGELLGILGRNRPSIEIVHRYSRNLWLTSDSLLDVPSGREMLINDRKTHLIPELRVVIVEHPGYFEIWFSDEPAPWVSSKMAVDWKVVAFQYSLELQKIWVIVMNPTGQAHVEQLWFRNLEASDDTATDKILTARMETLPVSYQSSVNIVSDAEIRTGSALCTEMVQLNDGKVAVVDLTADIISKEVQEYLRENPIEWNDDVSEKQQQLCEIASLLRSKLGDPIRVTYKGWKKLVDVFEGKPFSSKQAIQMFQESFLPLSRLELFTGNSFKI
jgi:hypothetical protein